MLKSVASNERTNGKQTEKNTDEKQQNTTHNREWEKHFILLIAECN